MWFSLFILGTLADAPTRPTRLPPVYECSFEAGADVNFDGWPDGWTRRVGREYPPYVRVAILTEREAGSGTNHVLRADLDGGGVFVSTPRVSVSTEFSYVLDADLRTERLRHDIAFVSVAFLDAKGDRLAMHESARLTDVPQWRRLRIGPLTPPASTRFAVVSLHVEPTTEADLHGTVLVDNLWFGHLPRMSLSTSADWNLFGDRHDVQVHCRVSGVPAEEPVVHCELLDALGHRVFHEDIALAVAPESTGTRSQKAFTGEFTWSPQVPDFGYYTARFSMRNASGLSIDQSTSLVVMRPQASVPRGEFGCSLPQGEHPRSLRDLVPLLGQIGVHWVKLPIWSRSDDAGLADRVAWFVERLGAQQTQFVGVLDQPPEEVRAKLTDRARLAAATLFVDDEQWRKLLDPVMARFSLSVRWWQLGADDDTSFVGFPRLEARTKQVKDYMFKFGQKPQLGFAWQLLHESPGAGSWDFLAHTTDAHLSPLTVPPLTRDEVERYLAWPARESQRWLMLRPLSARDYDPLTRARDLVERMLAARRGGAHGIFLPDLFDPEHGLMNADGSPTPLFLPWRTAANLLAGAEFIGSLELPEGSRNLVFHRGGETSMVVWNETSIHEPVFLGPDVRQVDVWGRERPVPIETEDGRPVQRLAVHSVPTFVTGLSLPLVRWQMSVAFDRSELASVFGREQAATFRFRNSFTQGLGGEVTLVVPPVWDVTPMRIPFKAAADELREETIEVLLRADANSGPQRVRLDFDLTAERNYKFSVYRTIRVGLDDVKVKLTTRLDEQGNLLIEQTLINTTDEFVNFNCLLFVPDRRRMRKQVLNLGRGQTTDTFVLPQGRELIGRPLLLRAEEIGGLRVLNYRFDAQP